MKTLPAPTARVTKESQSNFGERKTGEVLGQAIEIQEATKHSFDI